MRNSPGWWILIVMMILLDFYVFQAIRVVSSPAAPRLRLAIFIVYWTISLAAIVLLLVLPYLHFEHQSKVMRTTIFAMILGLFFSKLIAALFFAIDDVRRLVQWLGSLIFQGKDSQTTTGDRSISRSAFMSWIGLVAGGGLYGTLIGGFRNKYQYRVRHVPLAFKNLPASFRGSRIVQISDIHSGSLTDKNAVMAGVDLILSQKPDLILFTGDLVNNKAEEMDHYTDVFGRLQAPLGVYSTLGNHDYGDYVEWASRQEKAENLDRLKKIHASMGWRLLMNEHVVIEKNNETIALLGIENWSAKARFPKYGNMEKAYNGSQAHAFKILMSHDPSHWDAEVCIKYPDVDLMLAGHTHGMQFGVEMPGFRWSPVQYVYKQWAGLYEKSAQKLYVNRGYGFIGYPGRVGILPEITLIELT